MTTVIDASLLVAALVDSGTNGAWARAILVRINPVGPELLPAETTNVLRRLERVERISSFQAGIARRDALRLPLETFSFAPFADRAWHLRHNLTIYDAWYVALAEALGCPLATLDLRLGRAARAACEVLVPRQGN